MVSTEEISLEMFVHNIYWYSSMQLQRYNKSSELSLVSGHLNIGVYYYYFEKTTTPKQTNKKQLEMYSSMFYLRQMLRK